MILGLLVSGNFWMFFGLVMILGKFLGRDLMWVTSTGKNQMAVSGDNLLTSFRNF